MAESKKVWVEPELIVLVRGKPEEAVLVTCKTSGGGGPVPANNQCQTTDGLSCPTSCNEEASSYPLSLGNREGGRGLRTMQRHARGMNSLWQAQDKLPANERDGWLP